MKESLRVGPGSQQFCSMIITQDELVWCEGPEWVTGLILPLWKLTKSILQPSLIVCALRG